MNETEKQVIERMLDELIRLAAPTAKSLPKYGGVLYTTKPAESEGQFCGIFVYKNHVQLSFGNGTKLKDPAGVLLGAGKYRRHVNFQSPDEVDSEILLALLSQSATI